jgi:hypothetical protein
MAITAADTGIAAEQPATDTAAALLPGRVPDMDFMAAQVAGSTERLRAGSTAVVAAAVVSTAGAAATVGAVTGK